MPFYRGPLKPQRFFKPSVDTVGTVVLTPANASLVLTGFAPTVSTPVVITPAKTSLVLTSFAPAVSTPRLVTPAKTSLTLTGIAPTVTATVKVTITPAKASLVLTGFAPTASVSLSRVITPGVLRLVLTGQTPDVQGDVHTGELGHVVSDTGRRLRFGQAPDELEPELQPFDNRPAFVALYAAGAITEEELVALIAA